MDASFTQNWPKTGPKRCPKRLETVTATSQYVVFLGLHDKFDVTSDTSIDTIYLTSMDIPKTGAETTRLQGGYDAETIPKTGTETARLRCGYHAETIPKTGTETARLWREYDAETIPKTGTEAARLRLFLKGNIH